MEQQNQRTIRPKHQRKSNNKSMKSETIFALMLASLHATSSSSTTFANPNKKQRKKNDSRRPNSYHHRQLQLQLLTQLRLSLLSKTHNSPPLFPNFTLPLHILSLLPLLLTSKYAEVVCKCAEFVGVASLFSLEMNEQIAGDDETVKGLIFVLSSSNGRRSSSIAACNAVLDMATTSFGRQCLVESSFLECLMWEGFAHVALHNWNQNQKQSSSTSCDSLCGSLNAISVILMRVAIKLIGDSDPTFRKACLVGAISLFTDSEGWLDLNQRSIFSHLIKSIDAKSSFSDALRNVTMSLQENEDPLQQIRWLQHLGNDEQVIEVQEWSIPSIEQLQRLNLFCHDHKDEAEAAFMEVKSKFCSEAVFEDVDKCYKILLEKYRKVRKQYTSGMLSLHCN